MDSTVIMQLNIRSFHKNKYLLATTLHSYSPDVILLNETNTLKNNIRLLGYNTIQQCHELHNGVAILIKKSVKYFEIPTHDNASLAIKIHTSIGPIIIYTHYSPPRHQYINTIPLNRILNYNLPTVIIGDFNAKHPMFQNGKGDKSATNKGKQLVTLIKDRNLTFAGPDFNTYQSITGKGKPDLIITNQKMLPYHYCITQGEFTGSDHLPIIFKISIHPIKIIINKRNYHSLNIDNFQSDLRNNAFESLQNQPVSMIDRTLDNIFDNIQTAVNNHTKSFTIAPIQSYIPNAKTKQKMKQITVAYQSYLKNGYPSIQVVNKYKNELILIIMLESKHSWKKIIDLASDNFGKPFAFWNNINRLLNKKSQKFTYLKYHPNPLDSEDSSSDSTDTEEYITAQEKANLMSKSWKKIFNPHSSPEFNNSNTQKVENWHHLNCHNFKHKQIIDLNDLPPTHPLLQPIKYKEYNLAITHSKKNKAPGPSGIKLNIIQYLPRNYIDIMIIIFNSILCTQYWPIMFKTSNMIFIGKPGKSPNNPYNFRPISLIEPFAKLLEKIITQRLLLYLEYHNLLPEYQFGFRSSRSTTHSVYMIMEALKELRKQKQTVLISTRDIQKAFDTVWFEGLIYKMNQILNLDNKFTALVFNYIHNRMITPKFQSATGPSFTPKAGVPQGSCLGPILFLIYVHDIPAPIYPNSFHFQYADDLMHIVTSDTKGKNKNKNAIRKMENELQHTLEWERKWKIKTCIEKCNINFTGTTLQSLQQLGGVTVNNTQIPISNPLRILGYSLTNYLTDSHHINQLVNKAKNNLSQLYRFNLAPAKVKKYLYIALIRPLLEYPSITLSQASKTNISKLQKIQNKALRFVSGVKLSDRNSSYSLHKHNKMEPINIRLFNLANKTLYKIRNKYFSQNPSDIITPFNKLLPDYEIVEPPLKKKQVSVLQNLYNNIFDESNRSLRIATLPEEQDNIPKPTAKYT